MDSHPGVLFREGPAGRRAVLVGGPDVWEVIRAVKSARVGEAELTGDGVLALVAENTGLNRRALDVAVAYYSDYPLEVDALIAEADAAEESLEDSVDRRRSLLGV
jgi:xanthine dehydrogenase molybdopterin-binding subunit B